MTLPHWVEEDIKMLPAIFTGQIVIEIWQGGVTRREIIDRRMSPQSEKTKRHALNA